MCYLLDLSCSLSVSEKLVYILEWKAWFRSDNESLIANEKSSLSSIHSNSIDSWTYKSWNPEKLANRFQGVDTAAHQCFTHPLSFHLFVSDTKLGFGSTEMKNKTSVNPASETWKNQEGTGEIQNGFFFPRRNVFNFEINSHSIAPTFKNGKYNIAFFQKF